tara:strand:- start:352 stop:507 length:156 start_codon:yes stop_codon:yes gene_type:complete
MSKEELDKLRIAYIKVYGERWKEYFVKHYWCVYDGGELGSTDVVKICVDGV